MKKKIDDEADRHPFYSTSGIKKWQQRIKELEKEEKELGKKRRNIDQSILKDTTEKAGESKD